MDGKLGGQVAVAKLNSFKGFFKSKYRARQEARRFIFYSVLSRTLKSVKHK